MKYFLLSLKKRPLFVFLVIVAGHAASAQTWLPGFNFRKLVTIDKSRVPGTSNLLNFNVLIEIEAAEFQFTFDCKRLVESNTALPIAFALKSNPALPLSFQVDSYDAVTGKLNCWLQVPELITANNPGVNEIYFYYGGSQIHEPSSPQSQAIWSVGYKQVWHMNFDGLPAISFSANQNPANSARGTGGMSATSFTDGKIGAAAMFNGAAEAMYAGVDTTRMMTISAWIKPRQLGAEQVILTNDSIGNGYRLRINPQGKLVFDLFIVGAVNSHTSIDPLPPDTWTHITVIFNGKLKRIYLNAVYRGGGVSPLPKKDGGGSLSIAKSKENDRFFNGIIDELRIANVERSGEWILAEYRNQLNPKGFVSLSVTETNPSPDINANEFIGTAGSDSWEATDNWSHRRLPDASTNVVIKAGNTARLNIGNNIAINRLILESGANIVLEADLVVNCTAQLASASSITLQENTTLTFKNNVFQDGTIKPALHHSKLIFSGEGPLQQLSGTGITNVSHLEINQALAGSTVLLNASVKVSRQLELKKGVLDANGQLTLLTNGPQDYAVLMPVDTDNARIVGDVKVQRFIDGDFPGPSTARGWWLLSSPVYQLAAQGLQYNFNAIRQSIFVTGPGGGLNGFDPSPNNNATIYTHNQDLPGTLPQKYTGIADMGATIALGKGFYVFSRGNRSVPDAFEHQVQQPPFSNPNPYTLTYSGKLFTGNLKMTLSNRDAGAVGDGYNLLGNPYASAIRWGSLHRVNVLPFVWTFDPKNNAYLVTDNQDHIIHPGTGFFVKVSSGHRSAELTFSENSKYSTNVTALKPERHSSTKINSYDKKTKLEVSLKKGDLSDSYTLLMYEGGNDGVSDADAPKIGQGFLSISGLTEDAAKLAIDQRGTPGERKKVKLFVKGWTTGNYSLSITGRLNNQEQITLLDHYLDQQLPVKEGEQVYPFVMDTENPDTFGEKRFSLLLEPAEEKSTGNSPSKQLVSYYPNPVIDVIYIKTASKSWRNLKVLIRKINGSLVWTGDLSVLEPENPVQVPCSQLIKGLYILQLFDPKISKTIASFKILKH